MSEAILSDREAADPTLPGPESPGLRPVAEGERQPGDLVLAVVAMVLLVAYSPALDHAATTLRAVALWSAGGAGIVALVWLGLRADSTARWALGFLAWAFVSALASGEARNSLFSAYDPDFGWVYLACCLGMWALGRRRGRDGIPVVLLALIVGLVANMLLAQAQVSVDGVGVLGLKDGRADGFAGNTIFLGGLMAGAVVLASVAALDRPKALSWGWLILVVGATAALNYSGSRIALVVAVVVSLGVAVVRNWRRALALAGCMAVALVLSTSVLGLAATSRVEGTTAGGFSSRSQMWEHGIAAAFERPVLGWGPGQFQRATAPRVTSEYVLAEGSSNYFADAHNRVVETLVTTGIPGVVLLGGFTWSAGRRARGPLGWFALAVLLTTLLQPTSLATAPIALLLLGYACADDQPDLPPSSKAGRLAFVAASMVLILVGLALGVRLVQADYLLSRAARTGSVADAERAHELFPRDRGVTARWVTILAEQALVTGDPATERRAMAAAHVGVDVDPSAGQAWVRLGKAYQAYGPQTREEDFAAARAAYRQALRRTPWNTQAMLGMWSIERDLGHDAAEAQWRERLCSVRACP